MGQKVAATAQPQIDIHFSDMCLCLFLQHLHRGAIMNPKMVSEPEIWCAIKTCWKLVPFVTLARHMWCKHLKHGNWNLLLRSQEHIWKVQLLNLFVKKKWLETFVHLLGAKMWRQKFRSQHMRSRLLSHVVSLSLPSFLSLSTVYFHTKKSCHLSNLKG